MVYKADHLVQFQLGCWKSSSFFSSSSSTSSPGSPMKCSRRDSIAELRPKFPSHPSSRSWSSCFYRRWCDRPRFQHEYFLPNIPSGDIREMNDVDIFPGHLISTSSDCNELFLRLHLRQVAFSSRCCIYSFRITMEIFSIITTARFSSFKFLPSMIFFPLFL